MGTIGPDQSKRMAKFARTDVFRFSCGEARLIDKIKMMTYIHETKEEMPYMDTGTFYL